MIEIENDLRRAEALIEINRPQDALRLVSAVVATAPDNFKAYCLLARCHSMTGNNEMMLAAATQAAVRNPDHEWGHRLRSMALRGLGRREEALAAARTSVRIAPLVWQPYVNLTEGLLKFPAPAQRRLAFEAAKRAVELAPDSPSTHLTLGRVYASIGEQDAATACYERALAIDPTDPTALTNLAALDLKRGRLTRASRRFRSVAAAHPDVQMYANNVSVAANRWCERVLDVAACVGVAEVLARFAPPARLGGGIAVAVFAVYVVATAIMYARLPRPMRVLVRRNARRVSTDITIVVVLFLLCLTGLAAEELVTGRPPFTHALDYMMVTPLLFFRLNSVVRQWLAPALLRRRYRATVLGVDAPAIPRQRPAQP